MNCKKGLIFIILFICLLSMTGVCASDEGDMNIQMGNDTQEMILASEIDSQDDADVISSDEGNKQDIVSGSPVAFSFDLLRDKFSETHDGDIIFLDHDYTATEFGSDEGPIKIRSNLTIYGNNHTLDGANLNTIFCIEDPQNSREGKSIFFNDIKFVNGGKLDGIKYINDEGGAVYSYGHNTLTFINCEFSHNGAHKSGGAIFNDWGDVNLINCLFYGNVAETHQGGAVYCHDLFINNTIFSNNEVRRADSGMDVLDQIMCYANFFMQASCDQGMSGGAVFCNYCEVYNSKFESNSVGYDHNQIGTSGGAIHCQNDIIVNNTIFSANKVNDLCGGAIFCEQDCNVINSKFDGNTANMGCAIYSWGKTNITDSEFSYNSHIIGSTFIENIDVVGGIMSGALSLIDVPLSGIISILVEKILNALGWDKYLFGSFISSEGGAVYSDGACYINSCKFDNNYACEKGGAIYANKDLTVVKSNFTDNKVFRGTNSFTKIIGNQFRDKDGGAIYCSGSLFIDDSDFSRNSALNDGGAIYWEDTSSVTNSRFRYNSANRGGAIYGNAGNSGLSNSYFERNYAKDVGGAVSGRIAIVSCTFNGNSANHGGAVSNPLSVRKCTFNGNSAFDSGSSDDDKGVGGAVFYDFYEKNDAYFYFSVMNCTFNYNSATYGGAFWSNQYWKLVDCIFDHNCANNGQGGAVYNTAGRNPQVLNCQFFDNSANQEGGAIYCSHRIDITNCNFERNLGEHGGGAVYADIDPEESSGGPYLYSQSYIVVNNSKFNNNRADEKHHGGGIYATCLVLISNCSFTGNTAKGGGAIYAFYIHDVFKDSSFIGNKGTGGSGGAVFIEKKSQPIINNCIFENNTCVDKGGAICMQDSDTYIDMYSSRFVNNSASSSGGAVYAHRVTTVADSLFIMNKANSDDADGGAIYIYRKCKPDFVSCRFEGNTAGNRGGAIYTDTEGTRIKLSYSTFVDNHANKKKYQGSTRLAGHSIFNSGHWYYTPSVEMCWFGTNEPDFREQIVEYGTIDTERTPKDYLKIGIMLNETDIYAGNTYKVTIYFQSELTKALWHSYGKFWGDANFSNFESMGRNDMTADVVFTKGTHTIYGQLDHKTVALEVTAKGQNVYANITADNVVYGNNTTLTLKADHDGLYNVSINDLAIEMNVTDGSCTKQVKLNAGEYETHTTLTSDYFELSCNEASFNVSKATPKFNLNVSSNDFRYGDEILVSHILPSDATGNISYSLNKEKYANLSVNDSLKLSLDTGSYPIDATYSGDTNYYSADDSITIKINPAKNNVSVSATNVTYGEDTVISISADADDIYAVDINGTIYNVTVNNGVGNRTVALNAGTYYANATYNNKNYITKIKNTTFKVKKTPNNVVITADNVTYGKNTTIKVSADADDIYTVDINGTIYNVTVNNGTGNKTITLNVGTYYANATYNNKNYDTTYINAIFNVNKADVELNITILDEVYPQDVEGVVHASRDGEYNLTVGEYKDIIVVKNGLCYFNIGTLDAGSYEAIVSLNDDNYNPISNKTKFVVNASGTLFEIEVNTSEITYGETVTVTHTINDGAAGNITYLLSDGTLLGVLLVGENLTLPVLPVGYYVIAADYSGDRDFIPASDIAFFTVNKAPNNAVVSADDVTYGENTTIKVSADVDGIYTIDINGTIHNITVNNGTGNKSIALNAGIYYANATYNNDNYNSISKNAVFNVYKADNSLFVVASDTPYLQDVVGEIYASVDGEYNVTVGDYSTTVIVENGFGEFNAGILNAGDYTVTVTYSGDLNHKANSTTANINIAKFTPNVTLNVSDIDWGETEVITITSDIYGSVNITVNNMTTTLDLDDTTKHLLAAALNAASDSEYKATLQLDNLNSGTYPITAVYIGDNNIESIFLSSEFKVNKIENNAAVNIADVTYGENTTIKVSADIDGIYQVDINGTTYNITVNNGKGNKTIDLNAGLYYANVTFDNKNYNTISKNTVFTVDKADTKLSVYVPTTVYLQDVVGVVYSSVDGEYTVTIGNYSTTVIVENAFGEFNAGILNAGDYILTVTYPGDLNHKANSTTARVYITRFAPNVSLNVSDIDWGETEVITVTSDIYGFVNITVNNMTVTLDLDGTTKHLLAAALNAASDSEYKSTLNLDNLNSGTYPVTAVYIGDDNIESIFLSSEFKVNALNATINADAKDINVGDDETIIVTLPDDATGTVTATVDGKNYTETVENGTASITIPGLNAGNKTADIYYSGDGKYNPTEDTATFTVNKIKANMTIDADADSDGTSTIIVTLPDDAIGTVTVTVDGKNYTAAVENGRATFTIKGLTPGKHEIAATYSGDGKYYPIQGKSNVIVKNNGAKHENKTADDVTPDKKAIKSTEKDMLKATGNPIFALLLTLMTIGITTIRRF